MDQFDDNGWNEIVEIFGKDQIRSSSLDETEIKIVGYKLELEENSEAPDRHEVTSASHEKNDHGGKQVQTCAEIELSDEHPKTNAILKETVGPAIHSECQSEIHVGLYGKSSLDDSVTQEPKISADDERAEEYYEGDVKNDPTGHKVKSYANDETLEERNQDDDKRDDTGQIFTSTADNEAIKDYNENDEKTDPEGQKFKIRADDETVKEYDEDEHKTDQAGEKFPSKADDSGDGDGNDLVGQKFTSIKDDEPTDNNEDDDKNDPGGEEFTNRLDAERLQIFYEDEERIHPAGLKFMSKTDHETVNGNYEGGGKRDYEGQKSTNETDDKAAKEYYEDDNETEEQKFTSETDDDRIEICYEDDEGNDLVGQQITSEADDETEWKHYEYDNNNDSDRQIFTSKAENEAAKECYEDGVEKGNIGQKFPGHANEKAVDKYCDVYDRNDPTGQEFTAIANIEIEENLLKDDKKIGPSRQKFTSKTDHETVKDNYEDEGNSDPEGYNFTSTCITDEKTAKESYEDDDNNDPEGQKFTSFANDEAVETFCDVQVCDKSDPIGRKSTVDANIKREKNLLDDDERSCFARQKFASNATCEIVGSNAIPGFTCAEKLPDSDKNCTYPEDLKADFSCNNNVLAASFNTKKIRGKSHNVLNHNTSANESRKAPYGISDYKILWNLFSSTLIVFQKATSPSISFHMAFLVFGLFACISGAHGERIYPQDTIAVTGATVRFQCSWDLKKPVYWEWTSVHSNAGYFLYIGNGGLIDNADDGISIDIDRERGRYDLIITGVLTKHAGTYNCIENSGLGGSKSAELTVLDNWSCSMDIPPGGFMGENVFNIPEDIMVASCSVHFSGKTEPVIRWSLSRNVSYKNATVTSKSDATITTSFIMRPTKELDKSVLSANVDCSGYPALTVGCQNWTSDILTVNYVQLMNGPYNIHAQEAKDVICNPACLVASSTVYYRYGDRNYSISLTYGDDTHGVEDESKWLIMLLLSIALFVASLCFLLFCFCCARFKARNAVCTNERSTKSTEQSSIESDELIKLPA